MKTILAAFFSGLAGSLGLGGGGVLVLYLVLALGMPQLKAQGISSQGSVPGFSGGSLRSPASRREPVSLPPPSSFGPGQPYSLQATALFFRKIDSRCGITDDTRA